MASLDWPDGLDLSQAEDKQLLNNQYQYPRFVWGFFPGLEVAVRVYALLKKGILNRYKLYGLMVSRFGICCSPPHTDMLQTVAILCMGLLVEIALREKTVKDNAHFP